MFFNKLLNNFLEIKLTKHCVSTTHVHFRNNGFFFKYNIWWSASQIYSYIITKIYHHH